LTNQDAEMVKAVVGKIKRRFPNEGIKLFFINEDS
jgi:hypothetical protein